MRGFGNNLYLKTGSQENSGSNIFDSNSESSMLTVQQLNKLAGIKPLGGGPQQNVKKSDHAAQVLSDLNVELSDPITVDITHLSPAPENWNFFKSTGEKIYQIAESIIIMGGVINPLIVMESATPDRYVILSGHTRWRAMLELSKINPEKYHEINVRIAKNISDNAAQYLILAENFTQRGSLSKQDQLQVIHNLTAINKQSGGKLFEVRKLDEAQMITQHLDISRATFFNYKKLDNLMFEIRDAYLNERLNYTQAFTIANFSHSLQEFIWEKNMAAMITESSKKLFLNIVKEAKQQELSDDVIRDRLLRLVEQLKDAAQPKKKSARVSFELPFAKPDKAYSRQILLYTTEEKFDRIQHLIRTAVDNSDLSDKEKKEFFDLMATFRS